MLRLSRLIVGVLCIIVLIISPFISKNYNAPLGQEKNYQTVLTVWQIDSFSGGTGNRASFLRDVANQYTKKNTGVLMLVSKHTVQSLTTSITKGEYPDIISIGPSGIDFSSLQRQMASVDVEGDGVINKKRYFTSWAKGGYFLISRQNVKADKTFIVEGEYNSGVIALLLSDKKVENPVIVNAEDGLNGFIFDGKSSLIATQREIVRLRNKGVEFTAQALDGYSDLYEYALITSQDHIKYLYAKDFCEYLISSEVQSKLTELLLFPTNYTNLYTADDVYSSLENKKIKYTISPFSKKEDINKIKEVAKDVLLDKETLDSLIKLLKHL